MPCFHPLQAYQLGVKNPDTGKNIVVFSVPTSGGFDAVRLPCGRCIGCRLERSRIWAIRCMHESKMHEHNQFLTLTYRDEAIPSNRSLRPSDLTKFFKRLRKHCKVRHYSCGEYGDLTARPHYHAIVFGLELDDRKYHSERDGMRLYTSEFLDRVWGHGHVTVGDVTFESAAYVARYVMKKLNGKRAEGHYYDLDKLTGEITNERVPEFVRMSRKPGVGANFYDKFRDDMYKSQSGKVILRGGIVSNAPRYYDERYGHLDPTHLESIKVERREHAEQKSVDNTRMRLRDKMEILQSRITQLKRNLE